MKKISLLLTLTLLCLYGCGEQKPTIVKATNTTTQYKNDSITPYAYQKMLKTGMDVDWVKTKEGRYWAQYWHDRGVNVPQLFKNRGLSHVRIRIKEDILSDAISKDTGKTLMQELEAIIDDTLKADLIPIIAYQAKEFKDHPNDDAALNHVVAWWQKVAREFKGKSHKIAYDIVIETTGKVKKKDNRLNLLYAKATKAIHDIDPKRIVILAANKISNPYKLKDLQIPKPDDYVMAEWHFYAAGPHKNHLTKQWTTGTPEEKKLITDRVAAAVQWSREHHIPTWVGAWMANNYNKAGNKNATRYDGAPAGGEYSIEEQQKLARFISRTLQKNGIPYAVNSDTKFFDRKTNRWYESMKPVLDAMIQRYE